MNWFISISFLASVYCIGQSSTRRFSKAIHSRPPSLHHNRYRYSEPRQIPGFRTPERKTFQNLPHFPFHHENSHIEESSHHHHQTGWGWENEEKDDILKAKEIVKFLNQFLGVMGPFLFPLPYVLALIPFAIPAIPLSLYLEGRHPHHPSGGGHLPNGTTDHVPPPTTSTTPSTTTTTTTHRPRPTLTPNPDTTTSYPTTTDTYTIFPTFPTTNTPNNKPNASDHSSFNSSSTGNHNNLPDFNIGNMSIGPPSNFNPVTLFPFTLFLNSSFLGDDYEN